MASIEERSGSWRATVRIGGKRTTATFDTRAQALAWAEKQENLKKASQAAGKAGVDLAREVASASVTVRDVLQAYLDEVVDTMDSGREESLRINRFLALPFSDRPLSRVSTDDINALIRARQTQPSQATGKPLTNNTIIRELTSLSSAFGHAVKVKKWLAINPCHGARLPPPGPSRNRPLLTQDEIERILTAGGYHEHPMLDTIQSRVCACFLLALQTGMRSGEILRLTPRDYMREKRTAYVAALDAGGRKGAKSGHRKADRHVPLTDTAVELLDRLLATMPEPERQPKGEGFERGPYIVGIGDQQRDANWRIIKGRAGVADLHFHDTKHEAATRLSKFIDVLALSHAIGTKDLALLRDTYYINDAEAVAKSLPSKLG